MFTGGSLRLRDTRRSLGAVMIIRPPLSPIVVFSTSANDQQLTTQQSHLTLKCLAHLMALDKFSRSPMHEHRTSGVARCWGDDTVRSLLRITPITHG